MTGILTRSCDLGTLSCDLWNSILVEIIQVHHLFSSRQLESDCQFVTRPESDCKVSTGPCRMKMNVGTIDSGTEPPKVPLPCNPYPGPHKLALTYRWSGIVFVCRYTKIGVEMVPISIKKFKMKDLPRA